MANTVWVKVVGFNDAERHTLNTIFRLSSRNSIVYALWSAEHAHPPQVALIDLDSYAASLEMSLPSFNANIKWIGVGRTKDTSAWRSFIRPVDWGILVHSLDELFASPTENLVSPGQKVSLLVGMTPEERMYLRARLALAGLTDVDEAESDAVARIKLEHRHYDVVIAGLSITQDDPWEMVTGLRSGQTPIASVIVATASPSWGGMEKAEKLGCLGLLEMPFNPRQVLDLLQRV
jgi:CheY-like chemotaxis protein